MKRLDLWTFTGMIMSAMIMLSGCNNETKHAEVNGDQSQDTLRLNIQPSSPIPVIHANTPEEVEYLKKPFIGITTNGIPEDDLFSISSTGISTREIQDAVNDFLSSLSDSQLEKCTFPVDDHEWRRWHNIEIYEREGIALFEMDEQQQMLAFEILNASLSLDGVSKAKSIMAMEGYLKEVSIRLGNLNKEGIDRLGADKFYFTFMGTPSSNEPWGWQIDGHHLVINYFIIGDQVVMTPTFMGSELTHIEEGPDKGTRTFVEEGKKALLLYRSLDEDQKVKATLMAEKKLSYSQAEAFKDNKIVPYAGIQAKALSKEQKDMMLTLIEEYVGNMRHDQARVRMDEVMAHMDNTWFCWVGGSGDDDVFYYRIQSPVIMIEYDHHSPVFVVKKGEPKPGPVNWHVHTVVRTPNGNDYGKDLLRQHLEEHHHHH